jgi:dihydroxyacetone kinase-like predicted kinase
VRTTVYHDREIKEGDIIGIFNGDIKAVGSSPEAVLLDLVGAMTGPDDSVITVFYGQDVAAETAEAAGEQLSTRHPDCELDVHRGGQPLYYYLVSVE